MVKGKCPNRRRRGGFTLVEVLLVLVILVIIASLAVTNIAPMQNRAKVNAAKTQIRAFGGPLDAYRLDIGDYPQDLQSLRVQSGNAQQWNGPYLNKNIPLDPWGNQYHYRYPGQHDPSAPDIWSSGPDGVDGNEDDVTSWGE
jgi:general secretion pathway protein G